MHIPRDSFIAYAILLISLGGLIAAACNMHTQRGTIAYLDALPGLNGNYALFIDDTCSGSVQYIQGTSVPHMQGDLARIFMARIDARIHDVVAPLTSSVKFSENDTGLVQTFSVTLIFPGITLQGNYDKNENSLLHITGHFFDETINIRTSLREGLRFNTAESGRLSFTGPLANHPLEQIIQLSLSKHLHRIQLRAEHQNCLEPVDLTELIQKLKHIQHQLSPDILTFNQPTLMEAVS